MRRQAFTLIELLVVIGIIAVLASLILGALPEVRFRAKALQTTQRCHNILDEFSRIGQQEGNAPYMIQPVLGLGIYTYDQDPTTLRTIAKTQGTALDYSKPYNFGFPWQQEDLLASGDPDSVQLTDPVTANPLVDNTGAPRMGSNVLLRQLNPLLTHKLLALVKVLPADDPTTAMTDESLVAFQESPTAQRGWQKPWNDSWGNPLVVAYGIYQAALQADLSKPDRVADALKKYQYSRSIYISVAAAGPTLYQPLGTGLWSPPSPPDWDPTAPNGTNVGAIWIQANEVCQDDDRLGAWDGMDATANSTKNWDRNSFDRPVWRETKVGKKRFQSVLYRSFLSAPLEFK